MADREVVYLPWTMPNWITVVLMAALGYALLALIMQFYKARAGGGNGS